MKFLTVKTVKTNPYRLLFTKVKLWP